MSGPAALDVSRHWLRARLEGRRRGRSRRASVPTSTFESLERAWVAAARASDRSSRCQRALAATLPASVAAAVLDGCGIARDQALAELTREARRRTLVHALPAWPLPVRDSRGYNYAEVTAGGVALAEIDPATMESRACPGLYLVGEILDVDGRIGGFNFQWAWSSARVAGTALARRLRP